MSKTVDNAVRLLGDFFLVPGTSQILKGEYKSGLLHAGVGIASRMFLFHPLGAALWVATAANSYVLSANEKSLLALTSAAFESTGSGEAAPSGEPATSEPQPATS